MCTSLRSDMAFRCALCSRRNAETDILIRSKCQKSIIGAGSRQQGMLRRGLRQQGGHLAFYCQISKDFRRSETQHDVGDKRYKALHTTVAASAGLDDMRRRVCGFPKQEEKALNWPLGRNKEMGRRKFTSLPSPETASKGDGKRMPDESAEEGEKHPPDSSPPLFLCPAQRFFRLLAAASLTQVTFWTSYAFLPSELSGSMSYWGIVGSGAFVLIARHFAMHYVWEMDQISPVAFRIATHTFWGNKGPDRIVQIGTSQCQHTSRYIAAKIKGDSFYYLLDIKEGKFGSENAKEQIIRMFQGLRTDAQGQHLVRGVDGDNGDSAEQSDIARRKSGGRRWKGGWKGKA